MEIVWTVIGVLGLLMMAYGVFLLGQCSITLHDLMRIASNQSTESIKPSIFRRQPELDPAGTKVYTPEAWDEGIERDDV